MVEGILERLAEGVVLGDGGCIVELEQRGHVVTGAFTPEIAVTHPEAVRELHYEMKQAGCEVLQVMAFYGSREKLSTVGYADRTFEINQAATRIAREVAGDELLVAGDLSPTWMWAPDDPRSDRLVAEMFDEQLGAQAGVDFLIGETFFKLGEALLCLGRIKAKTAVPAIMTMSFRADNKTEDGYTAAECARRLSDAGSDIVGLNCMRDPEHTYPLIDEMRGAFDGHLAAQPVAFRCTDQTPWFTGSPSFPDRLEPTQMTRFELGEFATRARDMGVWYTWRLLRLQGNAHARDGRRAGQVPGAAGVGPARGPRHERDGVQPGAPRRADLTRLLPHHHGSPGATRAHSGRSRCAERRVGVRGPALQGPPVTTEARML